MRITCPACQANYEIPDHLLVNAPAQVRCARCGAEWAWSRAATAPAEIFELPDLFSPGPVPQAAPAPAPNNTPKAEPVRERIDGPVLQPNPEPSLPPIMVEPPPARTTSRAETPRVPLRAAPMAAPSSISPSSIGSEPVMSREEAFRRVIETTRQRSLAAPQTQSRRPQFIAVLALILLIALIFGVHFLVVHGVILRPAG